jgi:hypothetical protein
VSYLIGGRDAGAAQDFMHDVADRLANRVQLSRDGHGVYLGAVLGAFGIDVDYAQLIKITAPPLMRLVLSGNTVQANAAAPASNAFWERRWFLPPMWKSITRRCASTCSGFPA